MADSPVLYVYYRPDNDDSYPGVPNRHITEADWARFSPSQRRTVEQATTQEGYERRKVWLHRDLVDETEQERADREAAEQAARDAYERGNGLVRYRELAKITPGPGEVVVGGTDGPIPAPIESIASQAGGVQGVGLTRIVVSSDPTYPLQNGELLILLDAEPPQFFTDFSDFDQAAWSAPWAQGSTWSVVNDAAATGGNVLKSVSTTGGRNAFVWTGPGTATEAEIVYRWRCSHAFATRGRVVLRATGTAGAENAYAVGYDGANVVAFHYINGASTSLTPATPGAVTIAANTWYRSRAKIGPAGLFFRTWEDAAAEPETWDVAYTGTQNVTGAGFAGLMAFGTGNLEYDWVGLAFDGAAAPTSEVV